MSKLKEAYIKPPKLNLETYIEVIDRLLERKGLSDVERDEILQFPDNIDLLYKSFSKRIHPKYVLPELNMEPLRNMYNISKYDLEPSLQEGKKKPTTSSGKQKKFKTVMGEFGKGKLKPYHANEPLKSKKQDGTQKELAQARAIAFSEAGLTKESFQRITEDDESLILTKGQKYAVDFLKVDGLKLISSPLQLTRGNLIFVDHNNNKWMISNTGYIRKWQELHSVRSFKYDGKWQVLTRIKPQQWVEKSTMTDDEYMEATHILSNKVNKLNKKYT